MIGLYAVTHALSAVLMIMTFWYEIPMWVVFAPLGVFWIAMFIWIAVFLDLMYLYIKDKDTY